MKKIYLLAAILCTMPVMAENGALSGKFSVDTAGHQVFFSQGNLQYHPASGKWQFAENQTDYIGFDNSNISDTYDGWIDLFGWGTGDNPTQLTKHTGFADLGANSIENGGQSDTIWRSMSYEEWTYLLKTRPHATELVAKAQVCGVNGLLLLPDEWEQIDTLTLKTDEQKYADNILDSAHWVVWDSLGAVFLPAAGYRMGKNVTSVYDECHYSADTLDFARELRTTEDKVNTPISLTYGNLIWGLSVRLVQDYVAPVDDQAISNVPSANVQCTKVIRNGQLYIMYNGQMYDVLGSAMRPL